MLELPVSAAVSQTDAPYWAASSMQALQEAGIPLAAADTSVSRTQGRGQYSMEPSHYVELPKSIQQEIVEKRSSK